MTRAGVVLLVTVLLVGATSCVGARQTERISISDAEAEAWQNSSRPSISTDGRYVCFLSSAWNLVAGDTNTKSDIFVRDRALSTTERVSVSTSGAQANETCDLPLISGDGRWVAFISAASTLVAGDTNADSDVFLRDRDLDTTICVSLDTGGAPAGGVSRIAMSRDGRYIAYETADGISPVDTNGLLDVYRYDRVTGQTELVSIGYNGYTQSFATAGLPAMDPTGRYVAFCSNSGGIVRGDDNSAAFSDVFLRDMQTQTTTLISIGINGEHSDKNCVEPFVSVDAEYVGFTSIDNILVEGDHDGKDDVYWKVRFTGLVQELTYPSNGACYSPSLSDDCRYLLFASGSSNLVAGATSSRMKVFIRDLQTGLYELVSALEDGTECNNWSDQPAMTPETSHVVFRSAATNLVTGDTRGWDDIFLAFSAPLAVRWPR